MQIERAEQRQHRFRHTVIQLRLSPVEIRLNFLFKFFQSRQIFRVDARLRKSRDIARHKRMFLKIGSVERFLAPVQDRFQNGNIAGRLLDLVIGHALVFARRGVGMCRIKDKIFLYRLILTAGSDGIAADLGVGFDDDNTVAVLGSLHRRRHPGAAGADDNDIIRFLNRIGRLMYNRIGPEGVHIRRFRLLRRIRQRIFKADGSKRRSGYRIDARTVRLFRIRRKVGKRRRADVIRLIVIRIINIGDAVFRESHLNPHRSVIAGSRAGIRAGFIRYRFILFCLRPAAQAFRIDAGALKRFSGGLYDGVGRDGRSGNGIDMHRLSIDDRLRNPRQCLIRDLRRLFLIGHFHFGNRIRGQRDRNRHISVSSGCRSRIRARFEFTGRRAAAD